MKRKYADGGDVFREGMDVPANIADMLSGPRPVSRAPRMVVGSPSDLTPSERRRFSRMPMEPVSGEEVGMEEKKAKVYKKKMASGGYTKAADGCAKRGKTRGTMVTMSKGGYKK